MSSLQQDRYQANAINSFSLVTFAHIPWHWRLHYAQRKSLSGQKLFTFFAVSIEVIFSVKNNRLRETKNPFGLTASNNSRCE